MGEKKVQGYRYSYEKLSGFCLQLSLLLEAAVSLDEGLLIMAEDGEDEQEKNLLLSMSEQVELGLPFFQVLEETGAFPSYVVQMARLGQQTGMLDTIMKSLSDYYAKENRLRRTVKNAVTYPVMMVVLLLIVLFVLFSRVMPVFYKVYEQLGASLSPVSVGAVRLGGILSGCALALAAAAALATGGCILALKRGRRIAALEKGVSWLKNRSSLAQAIACRRFTAVLAMTLRCGLELEKGLALAEGLVENEHTAGQIRICGESLKQGKSYYESLKDCGLFNSFYLQMIKVGSRSGHLDEVMETISGDYEEIAAQSVENMLSRFEPALVSVLAAAVGMVLLSVMLPLMGVLSAMG